ncbi:MAG: PilN domain-containing protein [Niveispirillum sp.]|nr:PilN domain-containing protein [Niveispirillum sp.]
MPVGNMMAGWGRVRLAVALLLDAGGDAARSALPARLADRLGFSPRLLRLAPGGTGILSAPPPGPGPVWCRLDPSDVLSMTAACPAANPLDLWQALSLRMPELLPLQPALLSWDIVPTERGGRIHAVRRSVLEAAAATLADAGIRADRLGVEGEAGVDFLRLDGRRLRRSGGRLLAVAACLWLGAVLPPAAWAGFVIWDTARLERALAQDAQAVRDAAEMRDRLAFLAEQQRTGNLLLAQPPRGPLLDLIAALLPDDAVLAELSIAQDGVRLRGRASDAGSLVTALRQHPAFADARLATPITRTPDGTADMFTIVSGGAP